MKETRIYATINFVLFALVTLCAGSISLTTSPTIVATTTSEMNQSIARLLTTSPTTVATTTSEMMHQTSTRLLTSRIAVTTSEMMHQSNMRSLTTSPTTVTASTTAMMPQSNTTSTTTSPTNAQCKDTCGYGGVCRIVGTQEKCECDNFTCGGVQEICGSNGATYLFECYLLQAQCRQQKRIDVIKSGSCGCGTLDVSTPDFITTSNISCTVDKDNRVTCKITCLDKHHSAIPEFLMLLCYNSKWLRSNKVGKFVELANRNSPPKCYETTSKFPQSPSCFSGSVLLPSQVCVPCPPGSYHDETGSSCKACEPGTYQDDQGRASCKRCKLPQMSTTTGAESCYFYYGYDIVEMKIAKDLNDWTKEKLQTEISKALTEVCQTQKNCFGSKRRRRRSNSEFRAENIIVINVDTSDDDIDVEFLVVDPSSSSPVPDKAFSPQKTKDLIENIEKDKVSFTLLGVKIVNKESTRSSSSSSSSKVPIIVGVVLAILFIVLIILGVLLWKKRCKARNDVPPVRFENEDVSISSAPKFRLNPFSKQAKEKNTDSQNVSDVTKEQSES
ncbi:uncharacterized protein LOC124439106 isoform X2 [Xenia sp. Carnegie-2017]|uniref:uncharacterized protein LOC124439106 isoform X2 n=1 Tax=Xenia sp. Carnegie-2017 TaxID=2897299 RepID=UPI001F0452F9|nr:uncharacterized protein LOC124439106 isoform X2 [Xenia sp. Carnegie-2017]